MVLCSFQRNAKQLEAENNPLTIRQIGFSLTTNPLPSQSLAQQTVNKDLLTIYVY